MMKSLVTVLSSFLLLVFFTAFNLPERVTLSCEVNACEKQDSLFLFEFNGVLFNKIAAAPTTDFSKYEFDLPSHEPRFYYVGLDAKNLKPIILGTEENVGLKGTCQQFRSARTTKSDLNREYEDLKNIMNADKQKFGQYMQQMRMASQQDQVEVANTVIVKMGELDDKRLKLIDSLERANPYLAKVTKMNTYLSYQNHGSADETEIEYFATKYFQLVDWSDPDLSYMPWVYEGFKGWVQTIPRVGLPTNMQKHYVDKMLAQIPADSRTHMLALGGVIAGFQQAKSELAGVYAKRYSEKYRESEPAAAAHLDNLVKMQFSTGLGAEAPDFTMNQLDGTPLALSELRGKVVLVDFWASWCGPCRRENPNVVAAYKKYKEKGFDVLGVSLDKNKDRWQAAIEKDGLVWNHVSDLKGWANSAAAKYGVRSIPATFLLDAEGKIIGKNLRGAALEAKLEEVLGK